VNFLFGLRAKKFKKLSNTCTYFKLTKARDPANLLIPASDILQQLFSLSLHNLGKYLLRASIAKFLSLIYELDKSNNLISRENLDAHNNYRRSPSISMVDRSS